jgi:predicted RNA-binding protein YlxR (DUF448 family)/ribosomal protein L7Ae-like RNA K-turn-binding protein
MKKMTRKHTPKKVEIPERTCLACGTSAKKPSFLRFVTDGLGKVIYDRKGSLPGRGLYLCLDENCLKAACKKNLFAKGLKTNIDKQEYSLLLSSIREVVMSYFFSLMKAGRGAGLIAEGSAKCEKLIGSSEAKLILIPEDASADTVKKVVALAKASMVEIVVCPDKFMLADKLDLPLRAAFAVTDEKLAVVVSESLKKAALIESWQTGCN